MRPPGHPPGPPPKEAPAALRPPRRRSTRARGRAAEDAAARWLEAQGYEIRERNVVNRAGEIDLVARDPKGYLCFIEVKARATATFGPAIAAVGPAKQRRLSRAAALYIAVKGLHLTPCRFDVLGLDRADGGAWRYTLVQDAFPYTP